MKLSLSTNWFGTREVSGEEIADRAGALGFDALELGYNTTDAQVVGFRSRLAQMPVGSVHAFAPVPISAPCGYPELYALASFDAEARRMAHLQIVRNIRFAAEMGAGALVLHAGRVLCKGLFKRRDQVRRTRRGQRMVDVVRRELETLIPELTKARVSLGLENLPYREGFPDETEIFAICGEWVKAWFDTGHHFARITQGLVSPQVATDYVSRLVREQAALGMHLNDSRGGDDHLAPSFGQVDFAALRPLAQSVRHIVFEPSEHVPEYELRQGLAHIRHLWDAPTQETATT